MMVLQSSGVLEQVVKPFGYVLHYVLLELSDGQPSSTEHAKGWMFISHQTGHVALMMDTVVVNREENSIFSCIYDLCTTPSPINNIMLEVSMHYNNILLYMYKLNRHIKFELKILTGQGILSAARSDPPPNMVFGISQIDTPWGIRRAHMSMISRLCPTSR